MIRLTALLFSAIVAAFALGAWVFPYDFTTRDVLHQLYAVSGLLLWSLMTLCIVSAARPRWIEKVAGCGMNRVMAEHKVLGWGVALFLGLHILAPAAGLLIPATPVPLMGHHDMSTFWKKVWIISHPVCAFSGVLVTFWILSLIGKDIRRAAGKLTWPSWEAKHRAWAWGYLLMAPHCLRLLKETEMVMPLGWINLALTIVGCWAAVRIIRNRIGAEKRRDGKVLAVKVFPSHTWLTVKTDLAYLVRPGEFVYLSRPDDVEMPHPFSVASVNPAEGTLGFWIRPAGAWTQSVSSWQPDSPVIAEGPWGDFRPTAAPNQLWAAAGSGIAPFLSWLEARAGQLKAGKTVPEAKLFWCIHSVKDEATLARVTKLAGDAGVALTVFVTEKENRRPKAADLGVKDAEALAVCGPAGFVVFARRAWKDAGKPAAGLRTEAF